MKIYIYDERVYSSLADAKNDNSFVEFDVSENEADTVSKFHSALMNLLGAGSGVGIEFIADHANQQLAVTTTRIEQLTTENAHLKQVLASICDSANQPEYHYQGMGCGLEDRGITDRYEAMEYGWNEAMERVYSEVIPTLKEIGLTELDGVQQ